MSRPLLSWQSEALDQYRRAGWPPPRFLIAAFPGMGKTEAAAAVLAETGRFGIILVPQADTVTSWRKTLHGRGICPAAIVKRDGTSRSCASCGKPVRAAVLSYDLAVANPTIVPELYNTRGPCLLIVDEVHHLRSEKGWAAPILAARPYIDAVLALSGTPFRTDEEPVPFVHTEGPWSREISLLPEHCSVEYTYGRALTLKPPPVTRAVFLHYDAPEVVWEEEDGDGEVVTRTATLSADNSREVDRKARRHAVNAEGEWLDRVLRDADGQLASIRTTDLRAAGLILCRDTNHAVAYADQLVQRTTGPVAVYTQDYSTSAHRLGDGRRDEKTGRRCGDQSGDVFGAFEAGDTAWIISVRRISEGVDVPRLRVLVYAAATRTELFFAQAFGRVIRLVRTLPKGLDQTAYVFIPDDPTMRGYATRIEDGIADAEIAALEDDDEDEVPRGPGPEPRRREPTDRFVSATGEYVGASSGGEMYDPQLVDLALSLGEPPSDALKLLRKLHLAGHLNLGPTTATTPEAETRIDPAAELADAAAKKDAAVRSWAGLRLRNREFPNFGAAAKACHAELGGLFGVWKSNEDVSVDQVRKATHYAREQIKGLRHG